MESKPWYLSKTVIFNLLFLLVGIASSFGFASFQPSTEVGDLILVVVTIINLLLRFKTTVPVK